MSNLMLGFLLGRIALLVVVLFLIRWCLKIDRIVSLLWSIDQSLKYLPAVSQNRPPAKPTNKRAA